MKFTYGAYIDLIKKLQEKKFHFCDYKNYQKYDKVVILRHDIDTSLEKAVKIAKIENELGVSSYYFILLSTDFYNINSEKSLKFIREIMSLGGKIGLHFDEKKYSIFSKEDYTKYVQYEIMIMSSILNTTIEAVSMHRPSKDFLEMDLEFSDIINSYQKKFFKNFKYVSDSRMFWRENIEEIIDSQKYQKLHILTHPFWYDEQEMSIKEKLKEFLYNAIFERYDALDDNIRDFSKILNKKEIKKEFDL